MANGVHLYEPIIINFVDFMSMNVINYILLYLWAANDTMDLASRLNRALICHRFSSIQSFKSDKLIDTFITLDQWSDLKQWAGYHFSFFFSKYNQKPVHHYVLFPYSGVILLILVSFICDYVINFFDKLSNTKHSNPCKRKMGAVVGPDFMTSQLLSQPLNHA